MDTRSKASSRDTSDNVIIYVVEAPNDDDIATSNDSYDMIRDNDVVKVDIETKIVNSDKCIKDQHEDLLVSKDKGNE
jgi:hypothetical protein